MRTPINSGSLEFTRREFIGRTAATATAALAPSLVSSAALAGLGNPKPPGGPWTNYNEKPYGGRFLGCLVTGDEVANTNFTNIKPCSFRFRCEQTGQMHGFRWQMRYNGSGETAYSKGDGGRVRVELRRDAGGLPDRTEAGLIAYTWINNGYSTPLVGRDMDQYWKLNAATPVTAGTLYHLYFRQLNSDSYVSVNCLNPRKPIPLGTAGGRQGPYFGDDWTHHYTDYYMKYVDRNRVPWLSIHNTDGRVTGINVNFTSFSSYKNVTNTQQARQRFIVRYGDYVVDGVWIRMARIGAAGDATVRLEDGNGGYLAQATIRAASIVQGAHDDIPVPWTFASFGQRLTLVNGQSYRLRVYSASGQYTINAFRDGYTYGFVSRNRWPDSIAEFSTDTGASWKGWTIDKWDPTYYRDDMHLQMGLRCIV